MKTCRCCNFEKNDSEFRPELKNRDGLRSYCKQCDNKIQEGYRRKRGMRALSRQTEGELQLAKICTKCSTEKPKEHFRIRRKKYKEHEHVFLSPNCIECENDLAKSYYEKHKNDPSFKEKNRKRVAAYANKNCDQIKSKRKSSKYLKKHNEWEKKRYARKRDEINAKAKEKRKHPLYKKMMREYRQKNKDKIREQEVITKRRWHEKHRDAITDQYVINQLRSQQVAEKDFLIEHPDLIEAKRLQILIKREIKNHGTKNNPDTGN